MYQSAKLALALALALLAIGSEARAALVISINQAGSDIVAVASGSLTTAGLTPLNGTFFSGPGLVPGSGSVVFGPPGTNSSAGLRAFFSGATSFGAGAGISPTSGSGDIVGYNRGASILLVPTGYASGSAIASTFTFANQTFASSGITPGTYVYSYSATQGGPVRDTITLQIGTAAVPEPSSLALCGVAGLGGLGYRWLRGRRAR